MYWVIGLQREVWVEMARSWAVFHVRCSCRCWCLPSPSLSSSILLPCLWASHSWFSCDLQALFWSPVGVVVRRGKAECCIALFLSMSLGVWPVPRGCDLASHSFPCRWHRKSRGSWSQTNALPPSGRRLPSSPFAWRVGFHYGEGSEYVSQHWLFVLSEPQGVFVNSVSREPSLVLRDKTHKSVGLPETSSPGISHC